MARQYSLIVIFLILGWASFSQCPDFKNVLDRASYLVELQDEYKSASENERLLIESNFFCAFPNSFQEMEQLFGFDMKTGIAAPLYKYPEGMNTILFFSNLQSIDPDEHYQKYVNINLGGTGKLTTLAALLDSPGSFTSSQKNSVSNWPNEQTKNF